MLHKILIAVAVSLIASASAANADYYARWDQMGGNWTTGWVRHDGNAYKCGSFNSCRCGHSNYCGWHRKGAVVKYWHAGCRRPAWRLRCSIKPIRSHHRPHRR